MRSSTGASLSGSPSTRFAPRPQSSRPGWKTPASGYIDEIVSPQVKCTHNQCYEALPHLESSVHVKPVWSRDSNPDKTISWSYESKYGMPVKDAAFTFVVPTGQKHSYENPKMHDVFMKMTTTSGEEAGIILRPDSAENSRHLSDGKRYYDVIVPIKDKRGNLQQHRFQGAKIQVQAGDQIAISERRGDDGKMYFQIIDKHNNGAVQPLRSGTTVAPTDGVTMGFGHHSYETPTGTVWEFARDSAPTDAFTEVQVGSHSDVWTYGRSEPQEAYTDIVTSLSPDGSPEAVVGLNMSG